MKTITVASCCMEQFELDIHDGRLREVRYEEFNRPQEVIPIVTDGGDWLGETITVPTWLLVFLAEQDFIQDGYDE